MGSSPSHRSGDVWSSLGARTTRRAKKRRTRPRSTLLTASHASYPRGNKRTVRRSSFIAAKGRTRAARHPLDCAKFMGLPDTSRIPLSDIRAYQQFSEAVLAPTITAAARLMAQSLTKKGAATALTLMLPKDIMSSDRWTKTQLKLAFHLYCQLPFGRLHSRNPEIIELSRLIGRTPSAVAMKLVNFASLDPAITSTGRNGLGNASAVDREVWGEVHADWEGLAFECQQLRDQLGQGEVPAGERSEYEEDLMPDDFVGETRPVVTEQRIKQSFFRKAVLSSYRGRCCMSGLSEPRLLIASHIVPWSKDKANRLNPSNGLCLSAIHDRAFDKGLITLTTDWRVVVSDVLRRHDEPFVNQVLQSLEGKQIELPQRFLPEQAFLLRHRKEVFLS